MQQEREKPVCPEEPFGAFVEPDETLLEHARHCDRCRDYLGFVNVLRGTLAEDRAEEALSEDFPDRVMEAVRAEPQISGRRVSDRYSRRSMGYGKGVWATFRRYMPAFAVSAAAAALFLVASAYWQFREQRFIRGTLTRTEARLEQRRDAYGDAKFITVRGGIADVSGVMPDGDFYIVGQMNEAIGEVCLWAYRGDEWDSLEKKVKRMDDKALFSVWEKMAEEAHHVKVDKGAMSLPEQMWSEYLRGSDRITVLAFEDRSELWDGITLEGFLRPAIRVDG